MSENRLPREHIRNGSVIWYSGSTSVLGWNCPAEICDVDEGEQTFHVRSLDDCCTQKQTYSFDCGDFTPESRWSMFVPSEREMDLWLVSALGNPRATRIEERSGFVVLFDARYHPAFQWAIERWARKQGIETKYGINIELRTQFRFPKMEDAALCLMTFSQGMKWSMIQ